MPISSHDDGHDDDDHDDDDGNDDGDDDDNKGNDNDDNDNDYDGDDDDDNLRRCESTMGQRPHCKQLWLCIRPCFKIIEIDSFPASPMVPPPRFFSNNCK